MNYQGVVVEESLKNTDVFRKGKILSTKIELVNNGIKTPWLTQWTLHQIEVPESEANALTQKISKAIDHEPRRFLIREFSKRKNITSFSAIKFFISIATTKSNTARFVQTIARSWFPNIGRILVPAQRQNKKSRLLI